MPDDYIYAQEERIGNPDLFTGRRKELKKHLHWVKNIERKRSKSIAILARRKSGKTALLQRLYNIIWNENSKIIPFYIEMEDKPKWIKDFCQDYYTKFWSQYYAFKLRKPEYVIESMYIDQIKEMAQKRADELIINSINKYESLLNSGQLDNLFSHVTGTPNAIATLTGDYFVVMIDEFQYMNRYIYRDIACTNRAKGIVGGYHALSESKVAPMCVAGSYVGWLRELISEYFKGGRLRERVLNPRLTPEEGLECVHKYSALTEQPVTAESAVVMNELTKSDPFYISSIFDSYFDGKDLRTASGVIEAFGYEISDQGSELNKVWGEYINITLSKVNELNARKIVVFLSKNREQEYTLPEIKEYLQLEMSDIELETRLKKLEKGDLIGRGSTAYRYQGIPDDIFDLIFRGQFQEQIDHFVPDVKTELTEELAVLLQENKSLRGRLGEIEGRLPEFLVSREMKVKKKKKPLSSRVQNYQPEAVFADYRGVYVNYKLNIEDAREYEIDVYAYHPDEGALAFEIKNRPERKVGAAEAKEFRQKLVLLREMSGEESSGVHGIYLSRAGFTAEAETLLKGEGLMYADFQQWFGEEV